MFSSLVLPVLEGAGGCRVGLKPPGLMEGDEEGAALTLTGWALAGWDGGVMKRRLRLVTGMSFSRLNWVGFGVGFF